MAANKKVKASQLALAWVLAQGEGIVPIPGTKRIKYLEENGAAVRIQLSRDEVAQLNSALPPGAASGTRYRRSNWVRYNGCCQLPRNRSWASEDHSEECTRAGTP